MKNTVWNCVARGTLCALVLGVASPALALDPRPKTYREKQKHDIRDVQLGVTHPSPHGRSTSIRPEQTRDEQSAHSIANSRQ